MVYKLRCCELIRKSILSLVWTLFSFLSNLFGEFSLIEASASIFKLDQRFVRRVMLAVCCIALLVFLMCVPAYWSSGCSFFRSKVCGVRMSVGCCRCVLAVPAYLSAASLKACPLWPLTQWMCIGGRSIARFLMAISMEWFLYLQVRLANIAGDLVFSIAALAACESVMMCISFVSIVDDADFNPKYIASSSGFVDDGFSLLVGHPIMIPHGRLSMSWLLSSWCVFISIAAAPMSPVRGSYDPSVKMSSCSINCLASGGGDGVAGGGLSGNDVLGSLMSSVVCMPIDVVMSLYQVGGHIGCFSRFRGFSPPRYVFHERVLLPEPRSCMCFGIVFEYGGV